MFIIIALAFLAVFIFAARVASMKRVVTYDDFINNTNWENNDMISLCAIIVMFVAFVGIIAMLVLMTNGYGNALPTWITNPLFNIVAEY